MEGLNYHHLLYFYTVARSGTIAKASELLHLTQPTISEQLRLLENSLGSKLFEKSGRNLVLTDTGRTVYEYSEKIFAIGRELTDAVQGRWRSTRSARYNVGVTGGVPMLIVYRLLQPVMALHRLRLLCFQDRIESLLARLATHELDVILADAPAPRTVHVTALSHKLGECGVSFLAAEPIAAKYKTKFPKSLDGAPMLLPMENTSLRVSLEKWFESNDVRPDIVGEFENSALMAAYGRSGAGVFAVHSAVEKDIVREYGMKVVGRADELVEHFYLISTERKLRDPAAVAIDNNGRGRLFRQS